MLAGVAAGIFRDCADAVGPAVVLAPQSVEPEAGRVDLDDEAYRGYRKLSDAVEEAPA
ncbi:MAG: hypothetical protein U0R78_01855 [Nocardioidaceae bacterium]